MGIKLHKNWDIQTMGKMGGLKYNVGKGVFVLQKCSLNVVSAIFH